MVRSLFLMAPPTNDEYIFTPLVAQSQQQQRPKRTLPKGFHTPLKGFLVYIGPDTVITSIALRVTHPINHYIVESLFSWFEMNYRTRVSSLHPHVGHLGSRRSASQYQLEPTQNLCR